MRTDVVDAVLRVFAIPVFAEKLEGLAIVEHHPAAADEVALPAVEDAAVVPEVLEEPAARIKDVRLIEVQDGLDMAKQEVTIQKTHA